MSGARQPKTRGGDGSSAGAPPRRRRLLRNLVIASAVACVALVVGVVTRAPWSPIPRATWPPQGWLLVACNVGQGDALVLSEGPDSAIVVDTGPDPAKADRCLSDLAIHHIPLVVLTHFHADHIDGLSGVLHGRQVAEIETTVVDDPPEGAAKVWTLASSDGIRISKAHAGERRSYGSLTWEVLWPDPASPISEPPTPVGKSGSQGSKSSKRGRGHSSKSHGEEGSGPNNSSIVLHLSAETPDGPVTMLLTGDIEPPSQQAILAAHPDRTDLKADIFKVPHHGSAYQDPELVAAVRPRVSIISVGAGNTYGHPASRTLSLAASTGAKVLRTDRDGAVVVVGPASRLRVVLQR
jgi:competence protein ComEC